MLIRLFLAAIAFLGLAALPSACAAQPPYGYLNDRTGVMVFDDGLCSGFNAGKGLIGTSKHCVVNKLGQGRKGQQVRYQGRLMTILDIAVDGENAIVRVDGDISPMARTSRPPKVGDVVWVVGNPLGLPQMLRQGRVAGFDANGMIYIDCRCTHGDSGAAVFNEKGEVVAIYFGYFAVREVPSFTFPVAYPLGWSREEIEALQ